VRAEGRENTNLVKVENAKFLMGSRQPTKAAARRIETSLDTSATAHATHTTHTTQVRARPEEGGEEAMPFAAAAAVAKAGT
jgi:hypothetical protein